MSKIHIETDQEYKDRIFDDLLKDSEILSRIKAVVNRDTRQHLILTDIKLILRFGYKLK
jgi:hypothetical protein